MPPDETAVQPTEDLKSDRREMLSAALDAAEQAPPDGAVAEAATPPASDDAVGDAGGVERPRGPDGKFVSATSAPEPDPEPVEEPLWKRPPQSWKKDKHELWLTAASNPETAQLVEYAFQREEEMKRGIEDIIPKAKFADQVNEALQPFEENVRVSGVPVVQALQSLMFADHQLRHLPPDQKKAYALQLLSQYGVQFTPEDAYNQPVYTPPPVNVQAVVQQEISAWQEQQEQQLLMAEVEQFGQQHPDFEDYRPAMQALLEKNLAPDLATAYEKAKRLDDDAFRSMVTSTQAQADADKRKAADQAAKSARAAAVSVRSSTPGAPPPANAKDRRSMLTEQFDSVTERF